MAKKEKNFYYTVIFFDGDIDIEMYPTDEEEWELFGEEPYDSSNLRMVKKFAKTKHDVRIDKTIVGFA